MQSQIPGEAMRPHHDLVGVDDGQAANVVLREQACRLLFALVFCDRDHPGGHDIFSFHVV
jgi:hypothetical protein